MTTFGKTDTRRGKKNHDILVELSRNRLDKLFGRIRLLFSNDQHLKPAKNFDRLDGLFNVLFGHRLSALGRIEPLQQLLHGNNTGSRGPLFRYTELDNTNGQFIVKVAHTQ
jgi:hypothetical protein